jgi:catechol 2,3-dioxygenase-like lactoylglutathione lyase family enzyme
MYQLDHIHIEVKDRQKAAAWFKDLLGFHPDLKLLHWTDDPVGPLILNSSGGHTCLALFARGCAKASRDATIAFRTRGDNFLSFAARLDHLNLVDRDDLVLTSQSIVDHDVSWSIYFMDLDGNRFEITTYDYDQVSEHLKKRQSSRS